MLPTPVAADARRSRANPEPTARPTARYNAAIQHWSKLTRLAPPPTEQNRVGRWRRTVAFTEWMMGWPEGWVTDPPLSRPEALTIVGNGVVPQQAVAALRSLLNSGETPVEWVDS